MHVGDDIRVKIDHPVYDTIAVRVLYTLGGLDMVRGDDDVRGYYLSVIPLSGCYPKASDGVKILLKDVKRRSDKSDADAVAKGTYLFPMVLADVCGKLGAKYSLSDIVIVD
jgi:hypothetical protein